MDEIVLGYILWLKGSADIFLKNSSDFSVKIKLTGEAFAFVEDLDSVSTTCFSSRGTVVAI